MSLYSWIFGEDVEVVPDVTTIEQMITSHDETKSKLEDAENIVAKLKADLETLRIAISNRLESEKNRITCNPSESLLIVASEVLAKKPTTQPMFY